MAATLSLTLVLPITLPSVVFLPIRFLRKPHPPTQRLRAAAAASSQTLTSSLSSETPEARHIRLETEAALEWSSVRGRLATFSATAAGRAACGEGQIPVGRSREESERLLEQTASAVLLSAPLDFGGVGDVSAVVDAAAGGRLLAVREICRVGHSIRAARRMFDQMTN